jgi:hypothetical protein
MKILDFFLFLGGSFSPSWIRISNLNVVPDPATQIADPCGCGSGSETLPARGGTGQNIAQSTLKQGARFQHSLQHAHRVTQLGEEAFKLGDVTADPGQQACKSVLPTNLSNIFEKLPPFEKYIEF